MNVVQQVVYSQTESKEKPLVLLHSKGFMCTTLNILLFRIILQTLGKMLSFRGNLSWTMVTIFIRVLCLVMSESCHVFKNRDHVVMDTSICLFKNFTEPVSKWICLQSCKNHPVVSQTIKNTCKILFESSCRSKQEFR